MRTGLTKQEKTTDIWFDEKDPLIHIRTHNTALKKRLLDYSRRYPAVCQQTDTDPETGFSWIGEYDITADELLSGAGGNTATKTEQAERLILDLLADGKELASEDIVKAAAEAGISERTVQNAKRNMGGILGARRVGGQWYNFIKKKQPPEPAS